MSLAGRFATFDLKKLLFRRDAEAFFYSGKLLPLPVIHTVKEEEMNEFRKSYPFNFINDIGEVDEIRNILFKIDDKDSILNNAGSVLTNLFSFPSGDRNLGENIKWNTDYISGYTWKTDLCWKYDYYDFPKGIDIINPLLMGRLNQLIFLGKGYLASGDEKYTDKFLILINDFMEGNPYCAGINWLETEEVAIRLLNILYSIPFFIHSEKINPEHLNNIRKYILYHSVFIENNLPFNRSYGYLISIAALAAAGLVLKESYYGQKLIRLSAAKAEELIRKQFSQEGVPGVKSILFFPHVIEALIILKSALTKASVKLSNTFMERYSRSFDILASLLRNDDSIAGIGDDFIRRILPFNSDKTLLHKFPLSAGFVEFKKEYLKNFISSPPPDILFYYGKTAVSEYNYTGIKEYKKISYGYVQQGVFVMRNNDIHITVDASETGYGNKKSEGHNDILSFELFYKDHNIISDPGTFSIFSDNEIRNRLRSVKSHNTLYIDDEEPVELKGVYGIGEDLTKPKVTEWHSDEYEDILSVQHYAYARFSDPVIIKRIFRFLKEKNKLIIRDELFGGSSHQAFLNLIFNPEIVIHQGEGNNFLITDPVKAEISVSTPADILICSLQDTIFSSTYGHLTNTKKLASVVTAKFPVYITTEIIIK